jgi:hypothetical protein
MLYTYTHNEGDSHAENEIILSGCDFLRMGQESIKPIRI